MRAASVGQCRRAASPTQIGSPSTTGGWTSESFSLRALLRGPVRREFAQCLERLAEPVACDGIHLPAGLPCVLNNKHRGEHLDAKGHYWLDDVVPEDPVNWRAMPTREVPTPDW